MISPSLPRAMPTKRPCPESDDNAWLSQVDWSSLETPPVKRARPSPTTESTDHSLAARNCHEKPLTRAALWKVPVIQAVLNGTIDEQSPLSCLRGAPELLQLVLGPIVTEWAAQVRSAFSRLPAVGLG